MTNYLKTILTGNYSWVPILLLIITIIIALYVGIRRRWSTSIFFFVVNIGVWTALLLSFDSTYGYIVDYLKLKDYTDLFISINSSSIAIVMAIVIIGTNLIALCFFFPIFVGIRKLIHKKKRYDIKKRIYISLPLSMTSALFVAPMIHAGAVGLTVDQESIVYKSPWLYQTTNFISTLLSGNNLSDPHRIQPLISLASTLEDEDGDFLKTPLGRIFNVDMLLKSTTGQTIKSFTFFDFQRTERILVNKDIVGSIIKILELKVPKPTVPITSTQITSNQSKIYDLLGGNDSNHKIHIDPKSYELIENFLISNSYFVDSASAGFFTSLIFDPNPIYR